MVIVSDSPKFWLVINVVEEFFAVRRGDPSVLIKSWSVREVVRPSMRRSLFINKELFSKLFVDIFDQNLTENPCQNTTRGTLENHDGIVSKHCLKPTVRTLFDSVYVLYN